MSGDPSEDDLDEGGVRCAMWSRDNDVVPTGSAGSYRGFLLVEWPLPWPRDAAEVPELAGVARAAASAGVRVQLVLSEDDASQAGSRRVIGYRWAPERGRYEGLEVEAGAADVPRAAAEMLAGIVSSGEVRAGARPVDLVEVLICGHGRRDRCCGSLGTALGRELASDGAGLVDVYGRDVRVWRTSHTGGHRFAPTGVWLPDGTTWAYLDVGVVRDVLARSRPFAELAPHYRGCAGIEAAEGQVLESAVLALEGWSVMDRPRRLSALDGETAELEVSGPLARYRARVSVARVLPVPECGRPITESRKNEREFVLTDLQSLS